MAFYDLWRIKTCVIEVPANQVPTIVVYYPSAEIAQFSVSRLNSWAVNICIAVTMLALLLHSGHD